MSLEKYAVIGNPIGHSKSPMIHQAFARQFGKHISYEQVLAPLNGFADIISRLQAEGYRGANVTVPFKFEAFEICDVLTERAKSAGAVNTLSFSAHQLYGDNTDGHGLVNDILRIAPQSLSGKKILLLGAGGAAQGVMLPLIAQTPAIIVVANRSTEKAGNMIEKFKQAAAHTHVSLHTISFAQLDQPFDVIINATSASLQNTPLPIADTIFQTHSLAYDMMYGQDTLFMQQARSAGAAVADGLGMLVEQAAEAFYLWHGLRPQTAPVISAIRQQR